MPENLPRDCLQSSPLNRKYRSFLSTELLVVVTNISLVILAIGIKNTESGVAHNCIATVIPGKSYM